MMYWCRLTLSLVNMPCHSGEENSLFIFEVLLLELQLHWFWDFRNYFHDIWFSVSSFGSLFINLMTVIVFQVGLQMHSSNMDGMRRSPNSVSV